VGWRCSCSPCGLHTHRTLDPSHVGQRATSGETESADLRRFLGSPLADSNRRPLPYHGSHPLSVGRRECRFPGPMGALAPDRAPRFLRDSHSEERPRRSRRHPGGRRRLAAGPRRRSRSTTRWVTRREVGSITTSTSFPKLSSVQSTRLPSSSRISRSFRFGNEPRVHSATATRLPREARALPVRRGSRIGGGGSMVAAGRATVSRTPRRRIKNGE
jgi:hypothetical protein